MAGTAQGKVQYRISLVTASFMLAMTGIADIIQFFLTLTGILIPAAMFVTVFTQTAIAVWLLIMRVNFLGGKKSLTKVMTVFSTTVIELVPVLDGLPSLTVGMFLLIRTSRAEDRAKFAATQKA